MVEFAEKEAKGEKLKVKAKKPDVRPVIEAMGDSFRKLLAERSCYW